MPNRKWTPAEINLIKLLAILITEKHVSYYRICMIVPDLIDRSYESVRTKLKQYVSKDLHEILCRD